MAVQPMPDELSGPLKALWSVGNGDWDGAHAIMQDDDSREAAWVHAYLHRKEGDEANAGYWYSRAGKRKPASSLEEEWAAMVSSLLGP